MKIDLDALKTLEKAGASATVIIAAVEHQIDVHEAKRKKKRPKEAAAKRRTRADKGRTDGGQGADTSGQQPDTNPRSRLFTMAPRLVQLGLPADKARTMLGQWAKITHDNIDAIDRAVSQAEVKRPADAIGYIRACLQERNTINGAGTATMDAFDRIITGEKMGPGGGDGPVLDLTPTSSRTG